jgi:Tol biopolymer transport system component
MFVPDGKPRRITNNLEMYRGLSVSGDGSLVTVQQRTSSSIWIAPDGKVERSTHFAIIADQDSFGLSWAPDGRILHSRYGSGGNTEIWLTDRDGGRAQQVLAGPGHNIWPRVSSDQRYVVFVSDRTGTPHLWRIDLDGGNLQQLTHGTGERQFDLSPDGQWVYFSSGEHDTLRLRKIGIEGGSQVQLSDGPAGWPSVSADGRLIALDVTVGHPAKRTIAILPAEGGRALKRLSIDSWTQIPFRWTPDGKALLYVRDGDGPSNNVWRQPLNGGPPAPATNFTGDEEVFWFDLASDGKQLACIRGMTAYDAVRIRGVR